MTKTFLTANDLRTGEVVYWTHDGVWSLNPEQAKLAQSEEEQTALSQILDDPNIELEVVGAYLVAAGDHAGSAISPEFPKKLRESHRLAGPSPSLNHTQYAG